MPMQWGKVKVVPYLLGEFAYWGEDINHQSATRTFGQVGVRANLPMSRTDTEIQSTLFNVNGVSHKVNWTVDAYWADASEELTLFPRYDALDDDAQEHFRRRFFFDTFGGQTAANANSAGTPRASNSFKYDSCQTGHRAIGAWPQLGPTWFQLDPI